MAAAARKLAAVPIKPPGHPGLPDESLGWLGAYAGGRYTPAQLRQMGFTEDAIRRIMRGY